MALNLSNFEAKAQDATKSFWKNREEAKQKQLNAGVTDQGERTGVTAGKNMDGFVSLMVDVIMGNGVSRSDIHLEKSVLTLPGFFRPTKIWDILVIRQNRLVAAIELKSQVGPSFGNNFNNRVEEAIGTAHDLWTAYREAAFGKQPKPFVGWMIMVEDAPESRKPVINSSPHFPVFSEFNRTSYLERYDLLCQKLIQEQLYTTAAVITSARDAATTGAYNSLSAMTNLRTFITSLAGHIASEVARFDGTS